MALRVACSRIEIQDYTHTRPIRKHMLSLIPGHFSAAVEAGGACGSRCPTSRHGTGWLVGYLQSAHISTYLEKIVVS